MANVYYQARAVWDSGQREEGLRILNDYLEAKLGQPVFRPHSRVFRVESLRRWDDAFSVLYGSSGSLVAPFGRVFPLLWALNPSPNLIARLRNYDFSETPNIPDYLAELEGLSQFDVVHTERDFAALTNVLLDAARRGLLCPDPDENRRTGLACLPLDEIRDIAPIKWGALRDALLRLLPAAYAARPPDFFRRWAESDALGMVSRFVHSAFAENYPAPATVRMNLERVIRLAPAYRDALVDALGRVLTQTSAEAQQDLVRYDAALPEEDASGWLHKLRGELHCGP